jgi:hypothetical protein
MEMPVSDAEYMLRAASEGTLVLADSPETGTGVHVGPGPIQGMIVQVYCPDGSGTSPTLDIVINECDTLGGSYSLVPGGTIPQITAAGTYQHHIHWTKRYLQFVATLTGTGADFGAVTIGLTPGEIATT